MIRFIYDHNGHEVEANANGSTSEITAELGVLVNISYNLIRSRSPEAAEAFKRGLLLALLPGSPVWDKADVPDPHVGVKMVRIDGGRKEAQCG